MRRSILAAIVVALGCAGGDATPDGSPQAAFVPDTNIAPAWAVAPSKNNLQCVPQVVGPRDTLTLRMDGAHGSSVMITAPDGIPYIVVFYGNYGPDRGARRTLMPPEQFAALDELRLPVRTTMAGVWVAGRDTNEVLFQTPGTYRVRVGNDMETDGPDYAECLVTYRPSKLR